MVGEQAGVERLVKRFVVEYLVAEDLAEKWEIEGLVEHPVVGELEAEEQVIEDLVEEWLLGHFCMLERPYSHSRPRLVHSV